MVRIDVFLGVEAMARQSPDRDEIGVRLKLVGPMAGPVSGGLRTLVVRHGFAMSGLLEGRPCRGPSVRRPTTETQTSSTPTL